MMMQVTPLVLEAHRRSQRFHAAIARRAALVPQRDERDIRPVPGIAFGIPKMLPPRPPARNHEPDWWYCMWFFGLVFEKPRLESGAIRIEEIIRAVTLEFSVTKNDLLSRRKAPRVAVPRMAGYYLAKQLTGRSLPEIGRRFGGRDHTSILAGIRRIALLRENDAALDTHIRNVVAALGGSND
jgi:hypothetical protein